MREKNIRARGRVMRLLSMCTCCETDGEGGVSCGLDSGWVVSQQPQEEAACGAPVCLILLVFQSEKIGERERERGDINSFMLMCTQNKGWTLKHDLLTTTHTAWSLSRQTQSYRRREDRAERPLQAPPPSEVITRWVWLLVPNHTSSDNKTCS